MKRKMGLLAPAKSDSATFYAVFLAAQLSEILTE
jgi:hypothetical protein